MISSSGYQSSLKVREFFKHLLTLPNYLTILGAGSNYGVDMYIKQTALELDLGYKEFNPYHTPHNLYSAFPQYRYNKKFSTANFAARYTALVKDADKLIIFQDKNASDSFINSIIQRHEKGKLLCPAVVLYEQ